VEMCINVLNLLFILLDGRPGFQKTSSFSNHWRPAFHLENLFQSPCFFALWLRQFLAEL